jgi:hypothetical protein
LNLDKEDHSIMVTQTCSEPAMQNRMEAAALFIHVRDNSIMLRLASSYLAKALQDEGIDNIRSLVSMREVDVMQLHCMQEVSPETATVHEVMSDLPLQQSHQTGVLLLVFLAYCNWRGKEENEHGTINERRLDLDYFKKF